ncbi:MAG: hypothetical protein ACTSYB_05500 [Candidatus Helarchaeota archaeon]
MSWFLIVLLVAAIFLAVLWTQYGIREHDSFVLAMGLLQIGLGVLWALLLIFL